MENNVYIRSSRSIKSISIIRILCILPLIFFGIYKNGIHLYQEKYISAAGMLKPIIFIVGSALIGAIINLIYEYGLKKSKDSFFTVLFSSFHIEYGILLACVMSLEVHLGIYFGIITAVFFISKFLNDRINIICISFILIYFIQTYFFDFSYLNAYESSKTFSLEFMDYLIGRGAGGIASTHILLLILGLFGIGITNNNKTTITISMMLSYTICMSVYVIFAKQNIVPILFSNNIIFISSFIATDSVTSCYTSGGKIVFGVLSGILSFAFYFFNPIIAPFLAVLLVSLFNNLIDRKASRLKKIA